MTILVQPTDSDRAWLVHVSAEPAVTDRVVSTSSTGGGSGGGPVKADIVLTASAVALYLTLWNRSDEVAPQGDWDLWREGSPIRW